MTTTPSNPSATNGGGLSSEVLRYASGIAVAFVIVVILLVVAIAVYRGVNLNSSSQLIGLLAAVGSLVALLVGLLRTSQIASAVNGHLAAHVALTDTDVAVRAAIDARLRELGILQVRATAPEPVEAHEKP